MVFDEGSVLKIHPLTIIILLANKLSFQGPSGVSLCYKDIPTQVQYEHLHYYILNYIPELFCLLILPNSSTAADLAIFSGQPLESQIMFYVTISKRGIEAKKSV